MAYFDTSVIVKWYVLEANTLDARRLRMRFEPPAVLTHLHRVELAATWQLKVFRGELTSGGADKAGERLSQDLDAGLWIAPEYDLPALFSSAERLARAHSAATGARALDVIHVAAAVELGSRDFVTADERQAKLAEAAGLKVTRL